MTGKRKNTPPEPNRSTRETRQSQYLPKTQVEQATQNTNDSPSNSAEKDSISMTSNSTMIDPHLINAMKATSVGSRSSCSAFNASNTFGGSKSGQMRDIIEIDVLTINDLPYTSSMTEKAVYNEIYKGVYKLQKEIIHGICCGWRGHPFITIKLSKKINIDKLPAKFSYSRFYETDDGERLDYKISCETRGVRTYVPGYMTERNYIRWLKIDQDG